MPFTKKLLTLALLVLLSAGMTAQSSPVKGFMKKKKKRDRSEVTKISLGRLPILIASWFVDDDAKVFLKYARKFRMLQVTTDHEVAAADWRKLQKKMDRCGYEEMIVIRDKTNDVSLRMLGKDDRIKFLTAFIRDGDEHTIIELKTKISYDEITELITVYTE